MTKIKKLSPDEAQKIAAGEVVERPANVLKELLENAIDAQSTKITIYIKDGGKRLIRVVDNGYGMSDTDALLCFEQHATSKITHVEQLTAISTFGFRGEALASIAAVSKTTLVTKEQDAQMGTKIQMVAGACNMHEPMHANTGTDITIEDLFFNVPARKKFLKTRETEWRQIQNLFFAFCFAHHTIDFKLYSEEKLLYNCPSVTDLHERVPQLYEQMLAKQIIPLAQTDKAVTISGLISTHQLERYDRNMIFLFVNKRWVKDINLSRSFIKGYQRVLQPGRYPAGCLFITVNQEEVDINIHPRKEEVQFLHPRHVQQAVTSTIANRLQEHLSEQINKAKQVTPPNIVHASTNTRTTASAPFNPFNFDQFLHHPARSIPTMQPAFFKPEQEPMPIVKQQEVAQPFVEPIAQQTRYDQEHHYHIIGQFDKTYILLEQHDGLLLIDQHAAHERILYEQFRSTKGAIASISLMFPHIIQLTPDDVLTITQHTALFKEYGIELEPFGNETIKILGAPLQLKHAPLHEIIKDALSYIYAYQDLDHSSFLEQLERKLFADMACKAAVKAGDTLSIEQIHELIKNLYDTPGRLTCPHGRPTSWHIYLDEIKRKFKRDYKSQPTQLDY